jgi:hypothetical protein
MTQSLEIHHAYVGHGDATVIAIRDDTTGRYTFKALIDASTSSGHNKLTWYFANNFGNSDFNLVIASHYHDDHIRGIADGLAHTFQALRILDVGGYDLTGLEPDPGTAVPKATPPKVKDNAPYAPVGQGLFDSYRSAIKRAALPGKQDIGQLERLPLSFPGHFGVPITLATINGVPVTLKCYAANGYVHGTPDRHTGGNAQNPNNYTLAFILEYGAFRYFTGGDLGGSGGSYYDHESLLASALPSIFPKAGSTPAGHVCAFKANHHGSDHSNNATFLERMSPTVCVTSVGQHKGHGLPGADFLDRLNGTTSPSGHQGFFFTDLLPGRRKTANELFDSQSRPNTTYQYGRGAAYIIRVEQHQENATKSIFSVYKFVIPDTVPGTDDNSTEMSVDDDGPDSETRLVLAGVIIELAVVLGVEPNTIDPDKTLGSFGLNQSTATEFTRRVAKRLGILRPTITPTQTLRQLADQIAQDVELPDEDVMEEDSPIPTQQLVQTFQCH